MATQESITVKDAFPGNPYDGHILSAVLEQATILTQDLGLKLKQIRRFYKW